MKSKKRDKSKRKELTEEALSNGEMAKQKNANGLLAPGSRSLDSGAENDAEMAQNNSETGSNGAESGSVAQNDAELAQNGAESGPLTEEKRTKLFWIFDYAVMRPVQTVCDSLWQPISYVANLVISFCMDLFFGRVRLALLLLATVKCRS